MKGEKENCGDVICVRLCGLDTPPVLRPGLVSKKMALAGSKVICESGLVEFTNFDYPTDGQTLIAEQVFCAMLLAAPDRERILQALRRK
jgi:hypothetical protein